MANKVLKSKSFIRAQKTLLRYFMFMFCFFILCIIIISVEKTFFSISICTTLISFWLIFHFEYAKPKILLNFTQQLRLFNIKYRFNEINIQLSELEQEYELNPNKDGSEAHDQLHFILTTMYKFMSEFSYKDREVNKMDLVDKNNSQTVHNFFWISEIFKVYSKYEEKNLNRISSIRNNNSEYEYSKIINKKIKYSEDLRNYNLIKTLIENLLVKIEEKKIEKIFKY